VEAKKGKRVLGDRTNLSDASAKAVEANKVSAGAFAARVVAIIEQIHASGVKRDQAIAGALNAHGTRTPPGGTWHRTTVRNPLARSGQ
jgi:hypothetical protein